MSFPEKNSRLNKAKLKKILFFLCMLFVFVFLSLFSIGLAKLMNKGFSLKVFHEALAFANKIISDPTYLLSVYWQYIKIFTRLAMENKLSVAASLPMIPLLFLVSFIGIYLGRWFKKFYRKRKKFKFASLSELLKLDIFAKHFFVLGYAKDALLEIKKNSSLLVLGETSTSKTSSSVIPSILEAENSSLFVVSSQNDVAKYTSGYRAKLGKVFYLNWGLCDDAIKKEYSARWNPLSAKEMPVETDVKEGYLYGMCKYFIHHALPEKINDEVISHKLVVKTFYALLSFFVLKIERAQANDYFLSCFLENEKLRPDDKDLLLSYYVLMNQEYAAPAIENLQANNLNMENYLPIGSWEGVPDNWRGKELNFSMFYDWLLRCFFKFKKQNKNNADFRLTLAKYCLEEAAFFGYAEKHTELLQMVVDLTPEQREIVFSYILEALSCFKLPSIRERTSTSDFKIADLYAEKDVITVYSLAEEKTYSFINKLFVDMVLNYNLSHFKGLASPLNFIFDNVEQQPRYEALSASFAEENQINSSYLFTVSFYDMLKQKYSLSEIAGFLQKVEHKVLYVQNYKNAAKLLKNVFLESGVLADDDVHTKEYFESLIWDMNNKIGHDISRKDVLLLAPKINDYPFCLKAAFFAQNETLKNKAEIPTAYFLTKEQFDKRNSQDIDVPDLLQMINKLGYKLEDAAEIEDALAETNKDEFIEPEKEQKQSSQVEDWWLEEDAFTQEDSDAKNPFSSSN